MVYFPIDANILKNTQILLKNHRAIFALSVPAAERGPSGDTPTRHAGHSAFPARRGYKWASQPPPRRRITRCPFQCIGADQMRTLRKGRDRVRQPGDLRSLVRVAEDWQGTGRLSHAGRRRAPARKADRSVRPSVVIARDNDPRAAMLHGLSATQHMAGRHQPQGDTVDPGVVAIGGHGRRGCASSWHGPPAAQGQYKIAGVQ